MPTATSDRAKTSTISLNLIDIPADARSHDPAALEVLAHDMNVQGQLQEIIVMVVNRQQAAGKNTVASSLLPVASRYEVISGVGRTLAARKLGWKEIRASVRENVSPFDRARITFAENEDREDVDPFYQATLITKMLKTKDCEQQELAKELGVSVGLVNAYVSIDALPKEISRQFKRLNLGQLIQIARLNSDDSKIEYAENCAKNDWSVRQLKALVDRALKKPAVSRTRRPDPPPLPDPLKNVWPDVQSKFMEGGDAFWEVKYGTHKLPTKDSIEGWFFFVKPQLGEPKPALARWFRQMAQVLGGDTVEDSFAGLMEAKQAANEELAEVIGPVRLPRTAAENKELTDLAVRGTPKDVYTWIYGKGHRMVDVAPETWKAIDRSPAEGLKQILEGIRQFEKMRT